MNRILTRYGVQATFSICLRDYTNGDIITSPTLAAGDVKLSKDNAALANLGTLPATTPASSGIVMATLSATELQCKEAFVKFVDQTVTKEWNDEFIVIETYGHPSSKHPELGTEWLQYGTAQAGAAGTITLSSGASATDDIYNGMLVQIIDGTGAGQVRTIIDYVGSTKVATIDKAWVTNPNGTSIYTVRAIRSSMMEGLEVNYSTPTVDWLVAEAMRIILSSAAAPLSGASGSNVTIRDVRDTKNRIAATIDVDGNRSAITFDKN